LRDFVSRCFVIILAMTGLMVPPLALHIGEARTLKMQLPVLLDRANSVSLTSQLTQQLREAIRRRQIAAGTRLPSSRQLSEQLSVSRNTVVRAYDALVAEGFVETRPASGIFAARHLPDEPPPKAAEQLAPALAEAADAMPVPMISIRAPNLHNQNRSRLSFDFFPGQPNAALFPLKTWRRLLQQSLSQGGGAGLAHYGDPSGLTALRSAIAGHLAASRGVVADPNDIVVVSGVQEGLNIAASLFLGPGATAFVETPCYQGAAYAFQATGARVLGVGVDEDGLVTDALPERHAGLLYITPSHQYPTGGVLSRPRRESLIAWARRNGCYLVEDDYDSDFRYDGSPLPAVAASAPDCTIYLGTFSKSLGAGLRLGFMAAPPRIAEAVRTTKALRDNGNPWLEQAALAEMIRSGSYRAHLSRVKSQYQHNRDSLMWSLRRHFGEVEVSGAEGGLHVFWRLPAGVPDAMTLEALARRVRVGVYSLASGGAYETSASLLGQRGVILGYASLTPKQIEQGVARLSDAIDEAVERRQLDIDELAARPAPLQYAPPAAVYRLGQLASKFHRQPALRALARPRADSVSGTTRPKRGGMSEVKAICRYPIKGLSPETLAEVRLQAGGAFPFDRVFALVRPGAPIDPEAPKWAKKGLFLMSMLDDGLSEIATHLDPNSLRLTIAREDKTLLEADLNSRDGRATVEAFFRNHVAGLREAPRLVRSQAGHFMDKPENLISLINLATVRSLESQWGYEIDPLRFRANLYVDGFRPWQEFDWIGAELKIGDVKFVVDRRNGRCGATNVNPVTGRRDLDIPGSLRKAFGHKDIGVYLRVLEAGVVTVGDPIVAPEVAVASRDRALVANPEPISQQRFMCRGCYFIYDEARGAPAQSLPPGTPFADIPAQWKCPDCGTDKSNFRPYGAEVRATGQPA
jgi:GntR family transcriptional regulator/MocR family aminotransferase